MNYFASPSPSAFIELRHSRGARNLQYCIFIFIFLTVLRGQNNIINKYVSIKKENENPMNSFDQ